MLVTLGPDVVLASDLHGRHLVRLDNSPRNRSFLRDKLIALGCAVDRDSQHWLDAEQFGDFESCVKIETTERYDELAVLAKETRPSRALDD